MEITKDGKCTKEIVVNICKDEFSLNVHVTSKRGLEWVENAAHQFSCPYMFAEMNEHKIEPCSVHFVVSPYFNRDEVAKYLENPVYKQ